MIKTFEYDNGEIQRVMCVKGEGFEKLSFFNPTPSPKSFERICTLYKSFIVPKAPFAFGRMLLFTVPEDVEVRFEGAETIGDISNPFLCAGEIFRKGIKIKSDGSLKFFNKEAENLFNILEKRNCVQIAMGKLPKTKILPVGNRFGLLSKSLEDAKIKVNANFFIMDCFDVMSPYDIIGTPLGLCVKNGIITNPPLFDREALMVSNDGTVSITNPSVRDLSACIKGYSFLHGNGGVRFFERPACTRTPKINGIDIVIVESKVVGVHKGGKTIVPGSGFIISVPYEFFMNARECNKVCDKESNKVCDKEYNKEYDKELNKECDKTKGMDITSGDSVSYKGLEDIKFGIQVGNSIIKDKEKTTGFISRFYNIRHFLWTTPFPPCLYPMNYDKDRAPRIALGADSEGKPMILWAEGKGKFSYEKGVDSCGASLKEMGDICESFGMVNGVNLDGGGSAQILIDNKRSLMISDRNPSDNTEAERAVPLGIVIEV